MTASFRDALMRCKNSVRSREKKTVNDDVAHCHWQTVPVAETNKETQTNPKMKVKSLVPAVRPKWHAQASCFLVSMLHRTTQFFE
jgi:hypothetical protein